MKTYPLKACQTLARLIVVAGVLSLGACAPVHAANLTNAGNVTLAWDRSPSDLLTNGVTYSLNVSNLTTLWGTNILTGTNTSLALTNMDAGRWAFTALASQGGIASLPSNTALYDVPASRPLAPSQMRIVFVDTSLDLVNWFPFTALRVRLP